MERLPLTSTYVLATHQRPEDHPKFPLVYRLHLGGVICDGGLCRDCCGLACRDNDMGDGFRSDSFTEKQKH